MRINNKQAEILLQNLLKLGFVEVSDTAKEPASYKVSVKGRALAMASAAKPFTRATAERKMAEFLERVSQVNNSPDYIYWVSKVVVFGSYLSDAKMLNDIDLAIQFTQRFKDPEEQRRANNHRLSIAYEEGKRVNNLSEQITWGWIEVRMFLKSRSRVFSFRDPEELELLKCPQKILYTFDHNSSSKEP